MTLDPEAERAQVHARYAPFALRDVGMYAVLFALAALTSRFVHIDRFWFVATVFWAAMWEVTKWRLRRNADRFAAEPD